MASKAKLVTRTATSSSVTSDNIAKDAALTHAELDSNLINLRDQSIGIVADDSATIDIKAGDSLYIQGGTNVTTSTNSDGTITINATASGDVTGSSTTTFTNKTIDANGTGNNISNIDIANMTAASVVLEGEGIGSNDNDTTLPTSAAVKDYADTKAVLTGSTNNQLVTVTGAHAISGESNLTFDGSTLAVTGAMTATTSIATDAISIDDNVIKTTRSNDTLFIDTVGTGYINMGNADVETYSSNDRWKNGVVRMYDEGSEFDFNAQDSSSERKYLHSTITRVKSNGTDSSQGNMRWRNGYSVLEVDTNGAILSNSRADVFAGLVAEVDITNSAGSSNTGKLANATAGFFNGYACGNASQLDMDDVLGCETRHFSEANSGQTINITNAVGYNFKGIAHDGSGTHNTTNEVAFRYQAGAATNKYLIDTDTDAAESNVGTLYKYREKQNSLTSSATIAVESDVAPVHTVTLAHNTGFTINNLSTGQSVTLIIRQDGTGSRTATFTGSDSTAVKFAGGYTALTTAASAIDVVTIYNDGTSLLGNCAKAYA